MPPEVGCSSEEIRHYKCQYSQRTQSSAMQWFEACVDSDAEPSKTILLSTDKIDAMMMKMVNSICSFQRSRSRMIHVYDLHVYRYTTMLSIRKFSSSIQLTTYSKSLNCFTFWANISRSPVARVYLSVVYVDVLGLRRLVWALPTIWQFSEQYIHYVHAFVFALCNKICCFCILHPVLFAVPLLVEAVSHCFLCAACWFFLVKHIPNAFASLQIHARSS